MSSGLYSGTSGLGLGSGLYRLVSSLWSGASGLITGFTSTPPSGTYYLTLEDGSGSLLLEDGSFLLLESAP